MPIKNKKSSSKTTTSPLKTQQENIIIPPSPSTTMNPITANNNHDNNNQSTSTVKSNALPSTDPLHELQRLGGVSSVLKLLDSRKTNLRETAALVLSNATFKHKDVCKTIVNAGDEALSPLVEHLSDEIEIVSLNVTRVIANCTTSCDTEEESLLMSNTLRTLGGIRLLIGGLAVNSTNVIKPTLLALGNMCCDDTVLCNDIREMGGLESLALLLESDVTVVQDNSLSALLNCCQGNKMNCEDVSRLGIVKTLIEIIKEGPLSPQRRHYKKDAMSIVRENALQLLANLTKHVRLVCEELYNNNGVDIFVSLLTSPKVKMQELGCRTLMRCAEATVSIRKYFKGKKRKKKKDDSSSNDNVMKKNVEATENLKSTLLPAIPSGEEIRTILRSPNCLKHLIWMTDHKKKKNIQRCARKAIGYLREGPNASQSLLPFIEQGVVPILHTLTNSQFEATRIFAVDMLAWMKGEIKGGTLQILIRTLNMQGNEELRGHVAVALVHLAFDKASVRSQFVQKGAMDATLSMLRKKEGRGPALEFLNALEPLLNKHLQEVVANIEKVSNKDPPPKKSSLLFNNPKGADAMLKVIVEKDPTEPVLKFRQNDQRQTLWTIHVHRAILSQHSAVFKDFFNEKLDQFEYEIKVTAVEPFRAIVQYLYSGDSEILWTRKRGAQLNSNDKKVSSGDRVGCAEVAAKSMLLASKYGIKSAKRIAAEKALTLIEIDNVVTVLHSSIKCKEYELSSVCFSYIVENFVPFLRSSNGKSQLNVMIGLMRTFITEAVAGMEVLEMKKRSGNNSKKKLV